MIELVQKCQQGDDLAWEALVRQLQSRIYGLAYSYIQHREEALDLAQDIFVRIYQNIHRCRDLQAFLGWALALARHVCIDRLRQKKAKPQHQIQVDDLPLEDDLPNPSQAFALGSRQKLVYAALKQLSAISREMIILKEIQGLKLKEIAHLLDLPEGTVKSRSGRARVELAKAVLELDPHFKQSPAQARS